MVYPSFPAGIKGNTIAFFFLERTEMLQGRACWRWGSGMAGSWGFPLESSWALLKPSLLRLSPDWIPFVPLWDPPGSHCPLLWDPPGPHLAPLGVLLTPLGHHWSFRKCVTVVEFIYPGPFCHPPEPPGASCPPLGSLAPLLLPFGVLLDTIEALPAPFVTLLPPCGSPLRPSWISFPPPLEPFWASLSLLWDPPGSLCPPWDTPGALWLTAGPPYASIFSSYSCRNSGTVEKSKSPICALFSSPNTCLSKFKTYFNLQFSTSYQDSFLQQIYMCVASSLPPRTQHNTTPSSAPHPLISGRRL